MHPNLVTFWCCSIILTYGHESVTAGECTSRSRLHRQTPRALTERHFRQQPRNPRSVDVLGSQKNVTRGNSTSRATFRRLRSIRSRGRISVLSSSRYLVLSIIYALVCTSLLQIYTRDKEDSGALSCRRRLTRSVRRLVKAGQLHTSECL